MLKTDRLAPLVGLAALAGALALLPARAAAPASEVYELDFDLIRGIAQATIVDQIDIPNIADWQEFWRFMQDALHAESVEDLADAYPGVQRALSYLQAMPEAKASVAWLRQRQDYCDVARQALALYPSVSKPAKQSAPPVGKIRLAPPRAPVAAPPAPHILQKRNAYLRSQDTWLKKLRGRLKPDDAANVIPQLKHVFAAEGVPPEWAWLAEVESSLNAQARSPVGAAGLFQFMPATAQRFGLSLAPQDERLAPAKSARAAAKYLRVLYGRFGSWPLVLAAYNAGEGRVSRALQKKSATTFDQIVDDLAVETQMYVPKVCATIKLREGVVAAELPPPKPAK
jgi:membrane-bound lytic murein transglycosylase D